MNYANPTTNSVPENTINVSYDQLSNIIGSFSGQDHSISIPRAYLEFVGGAYEIAAVLNEIVFWSKISQKNGDDGWFYRPYKEWEEKFLINPGTMSRILKFLKGDNDKGIPLIETVVKKVRHKTGSYSNEPYIHIRVIWKQFIKAFDEFLKGVLGAIVRITASKAKNLVSSKSKKGGSIKIVETPFDQNRDSLYTDNNNKITTSDNPPVVPQTGDITEPTNLPNWLSEEENNQCVEESAEPTQLTLMDVIPEENSEPQGAAFLPQEEKAEVIVDAELTEVMPPPPPENPYYRKLVEIWNDRRPKNMSKVNGILEGHERFLNKFVKDFCPKTGETPERVMALICDYLSSDIWYSDPNKQFSFTNIFGTALTKATRLYDNATAWSNNEGPVPVELSHAIRNEADMRSYSIYNSIREARIKYEEAQATRQTQSLFLA